VTLNNYILNGPRTVIEDDDRDPHVSWQHHVERAGRGGVDLVAAVGTPVYAPTDGVMDRRPNDGSAGNSCRFVHDDNPGWADVFSHLSSYVGKDYQHFGQGDLIAYSGNSGGVVQHLHRHLLDPQGNRRNPWDYFSGSSAAGTIGTPIDNTTEPKEDIPMGRYIRNADTGTIALTNIDTGLWWELSDPAYLPLLDARGVWDRTKDLNLPANEYNFFKAVAESARGIVTVGAVNVAAAQIDTAAIAKAVNDDAAARLKS
jgi:murein DD-endopeptidase MepM/ murein hydrolase activator NlpD